MNPQDPNQNFNRSSAPPVSGAQPAAPQPVSWPQNPPAQTPQPQQPAASPPVYNNPTPAPLSQPQPQANPYQGGYTAPAPEAPAEAGGSKTKFIAAGVAVLAVAVIGIGASLMLKGDGKSSAASLSAETKQNLERKVDLYAIERALVNYSSSHAGAYPTLVNMNDSKFRSASLAGVGLDQVTDPIGQTDKFAPAPTAGVYAYSVTPAKCDNKKLKCTQHKLTATLSDGQQISMPQ